MNKIIFSDQEWSWTRDTLFDFLYTYDNVPYTFKEFFYRDDIILIIKKISDQLAERAKSTQIFPPLALTFRALREVSGDPRVVIIGQDPYHTPGSATGLAFSLPTDIENINPSMRNIQKELKNEGFSVNINSGNLLSWARQGVLLLNATFTVERGNAGSHTGIWIEFTEKLLAYISKKYTLAWLLFGKDAQSYVSDICELDKHALFMTSHPSPYSADKPSGGNPAFLGSNVFTKCNNWLEKSINWNIN